MNMETSEQALRQEAIRRRLQGERRVAICHDLQRSLQWFDKWWAIYRHNPKTDFADRSRAPLTSPHKIPPAVEQAVLAVRQSLEAAVTPHTKYGLIGARQIHAQLQRLQIKPLPSVPTIQRILAQHHVTHPLGAASAAAYYPWSQAWGVNVIQATDIITKHLRGGQQIQNFHTIDHYSHAVYLSPQEDKSSATTYAHLLKTWAKLGLPIFHQFDNEGAFCGGHTHPRVIGQVLRLALFCGVELIFTPYYDAKRNYQIETFHSLWVAAFWSRALFTSREEVESESRVFLRWYHHHDHPPSLAGKTPAQMRRNIQVVRLTPDLLSLIRDHGAGRLPLGAGRIHFMRKVDSLGNIALLNETWAVGKKWVGQYVRATISTAQQTLTVWHKADANRDWQLLKTRQFRLKESAHDLLPAFRRNTLRCRDYLPG